MRRMIFLILLFGLQSAWGSGGDLQRKIYYYTQRADLFKQICFEADGQFKENAILYNARGSIRDTAIDCDAQAIALNGELEEIKAIIARGGEDCEAAVQDPNLANFLNGLGAVADEAQCPGSQGALNCVEGIACNVASSLTPRLARDVADFIRGKETFNCGNDGGTNCIENLLAGAVFNVTDTGCAIGSLFGYECSKPNAQAQEAASGDAAIIAATMRNEDVVSFRESPVQWMKQTAKAMFNHIGEMILERFGCARWSNPNLPFASQCLEPMSWSCANCSTRMNMICGVVGYIGGEILTSFFTGAAVGLVARAAVKIGVEAAHFIPLAARTAIRGRVAFELGTIRNVWKVIAESRVSTTIGQVARQASVRARMVNHLARRKIFLFAPTQDAVLGTVKRFNDLTMEAMAVGFRASGAARAETINHLLSLYPKASDVRSGAYASQGIRNENDLLRFQTKGKPGFAVTRTNDGADSRVIVYATREESAGAGQTYNIFGNSDRSPAAAANPFVPPTVPQRPRVTVAAEALEEVEAAPIEIVASRRKDQPIVEYREVPVSTRTETQILSQLGNTSAENRVLAQSATQEFRVPADFETLADDYHEAWMGSHANLRASQPELFRPYDELSSAEKLRIADEIEKGFRAGGRDLSASNGFTEYKARIGRDPASTSVTATVTAPAEEVFDTQRGNRFERNGITVSTPQTLRPAPGATQNVAPVTPTVNDNLVTNVTTGRVTTRTTRGEDAVIRFGGPHTSYQDREIILDILLGGPRKDAYFTGRSAKPAAFQSRYTELEAQILRDPELPRLKTEIETLTLDRIRVGNQKTAEEIADIERQGIRAEKKDIPCSAFANVTPGAFPAEGNCKRVKFDQDVNGRYCSCGAMGKTSFTWLVRCPTSATDFRSLATYVDELALPFDSAPDMCTRVDIPRGKECYIGPTSATFAGFGGTTQILCEHRPPRSDAGKADVAKFSLDFGGQEVKPIRWSPFSSHPELQEIIQRASVACTNVCDVNEYRLLRQKYDEAVAAIRARGNPAEIARLESESRSFELYMNELGSGRKPYPTSFELSDAGNFSNRERVLRADALVGRVDGTQNAARSNALIRAHEVAPDKAYFQYSQPELREKTSLLRYGLGTEELAAYRRANGNNYPPEIFSASETDTLLRRGLSGRSASMADAVTGAQRSDELARTLSLQARTNPQVDLATLRQSRIEAGQSYEAAIATSETRGLTVKASVDQYLMGGDVASASRVLEGERRNGTALSAQIDQVKRDIQRAESKLRQNPRDPVASLEVESRKKLLASLENQNRPQSAVRQPASPQVQATTTTPTRPVVQPTPARPAAIVVDQVPPSRAAALANEFRVGTPTRGKDPALAGDLLYRSTDGIVKRESQRTRAFANGGSRFMEERNYALAFEQSLQTDGELTIRMIDEIYEAGGMNGVNSFLAENFDRFNGRLPSQVARANLRKFIDHIESKYKNGLFRPQEQYLGSWRGANRDTVAPVSIPESTRAKIQNHVGLTPEQETFVDDLVAAHRNGPLSDDQINTLMNNSGSFPGQQGTTLSARPFRGENITSVFPKGVSPDDVIREYNRGNFTAAARQTGTTGDLTPFEVQLNGNRYNVYVCTAPQCQVDGVTLTQNQVRTVFPKCGRDVQALMKLSKAKNVLRQSGTITRDSFYEPLMCRD